MKKRIVAGILCFLMMVTLLPQNVAAAQLSQEDIIECFEEETTGNNTNDNNGAADENVRPTSEDTVIPNSNANPQVSMPSLSSEMISEGTLDYLYIESDEITPDMEQNVVVALKGEGTIREAGLYYKNTIDPTQEYAAEPAQIDEKAVHFILSHEEFSEGGYEVVLDRIEYCFEGSEELFKVDFSDQEISASYSVQSEEDLEEQMGEITVYATSEDGETAVGGSVSEAMEEIGIDGIYEEETTRDAPKMAAVGNASGTTLGTSGGNLVVAIDPGHDSTHAGAQGYGLGEEYVNLDVALACKAELEKYSGVTVILTHSDIACPNPGGTAAQDNNKRIEKAVEQGADVYVSIHMNASTSGSAHGCEVYIPNNNWKPALHEEGSALAGKVLAQLQALGLSNRGFYSRNSDDGSTYPDGSVSDYYTVQNKCKQLGITGIIIEHAFISNASDAAFLADSSNRTRLGVADATAIAQQFNLLKKDVLGIGSTYVGNVDGEKGTVEIILKSVVAPAGIQGVCISAVCSGYATRWITAEPRDGYYVATLKISDFGDSTGPYSILGYVRDINNQLGTGTTLNEAFEFPPAIGSTVTKNVDHLNRSCDVIISGIKSYFPVTSACVSVVGTNKIMKWYAAESDGAGGYKVTLNFTYDGTFAITSYVRNSKGTLSAGQEITQKIDRESGDISRIFVENASQETGLFDVVMKGVTAARGVGSVCISVTGTAVGTRWIAADRESEGVYRVSKVSLPKGTYQITGYMRNTAGTLITGNTISHVVTCRDAEIGDIRIENENLLEGSFDVVMSDVYAPKGIGGVCISLGKSGEALQWITANEESKGVYRASLKNLTTGTYVITGYMRDKEGTLVTGKTISKKMVISDISIGKTEIGEKDTKTGVFTVKITGVTARYGIGNACISVYNNQTGTAWVAAEKTGEGSFEAVVSPERSGNYSITGYVRDTRGTLCAGSTISCDVKIKEAEIGSTTVRNERLSTQTMDIVLADIFSPKGVGSACVSVYCEEKGTLWYTASNNGEDEYVATVPAVNNRGYQITGYFRDTKGALYQGETILHTAYLVKEEATVPVIGNTEILSYDVKNKTFTVQMSGIEAAAGIAGVCVGVYDISEVTKWYSAEKVSDHVYTVVVPAPNINDYNGAYYVTGYVKDKAGVTGIGTKVMAYVYPDAEPDEQRMWDYFNSQIKNPIGTAALMGNLYWESALMANNLQNSYSIKFGLSDEEYTALVDNHSLATVDPNESSDYNFIHDKAGYGLAQWTYYSRKEELLQYIRSRSVSIGNLQAQMEFLWDELCEYYPSIVNTLMTTTDIREASNQLLFDYEEPADTGIIHQNRRAERSQYYYEKFAK